MQTTNGAGVLALNRVYFASKKLQASCLVSFLRLLCGAYLPFIAICHFAPFVKKATVPITSGFSTMENRFGVGFKVLKPTAKLVPTEILAVLASPSAYLGET